MMTARQIRVLNAATKVGINHKKKMTWTNHINKCRYHRPTLLLSFFKVLSKTDDEIFSPRMMMKNI